MVSDLYSKEDLDDNPKFCEKGALDKSKVGTLSLNCHLFLPFLFRRCRKVSKEEKLFLKGLAVYKEELDIS